MYKYSEVPLAVRTSIVECYLRAKVCAVNIWFDKDNLRFHVARHAADNHKKMIFLGRFRNVPFDDLLDELIYAFQNE